MSFISSISDSVVLNACYSGPQYADVYVRTPRLINISTSASVSRTEITAGGMQVVNSTSNYVEMERQAGSTGSSTVMVKVGGAIEATGNITANTSDKRLKDIKGKILNPLQKIEKLNGILYDYNDLAKSFNLEALNQQVGLIAQEVEEVLPEAVTRAPFDAEKDNEGKPTLSKTGDNYLTIWYDKIVPLLVEGIKELKEKVEKLEEDNKTLKGE